MLTIYSNALLKLLREYKIYYLIFSVIIFITGFSIFQLICDGNKVLDLINEKNDKELNRNINDKIFENADFIRKYTVEKERVLIFSKVYYQGLYTGLSKTISAFDPSIQDLFLRTDYERLLSFLKNNEKSKYFFNLRHLVIL